MARLSAAPLPDDVINALPDDDASLSDEPVTDTAPPQLATRTEFSSDDEDDVDRLVLP